MPLQVSTRAHAIALILLTGASPLLAKADPHFSLGASCMFGNVDGYVQTPAGGEPGTTNDKRPTLDEIGIDSTSVYEARLTADFGDNSLFLAGQWIHMSGSATLDPSLTTNGSTFPAGTHVSSKVDLDWYTLGYRRRFRPQRSDWTLYPSVGVGVMDFSYSLNGGDSSVNRTYTKLNAQFGLETEWRPGAGPFSLNLILIGSLPITPPLPAMYQQVLVAKYRVIDNARSTLELSAGVAFEQIRYEDGQSVSNEIQADLGPMFVVGLNWRF